MSQKYRLKNAWNNWMKLCIDVKKMKLCIDVKKNENYIKHLLI